MMVRGACWNRILRTPDHSHEVSASAKNSYVLKGTKVFYVSAVSVFLDHFILAQFVDRPMLYNKSLMSCGLRTGRGKRKRGADAFPLDTHCLVVLVIYHASVYY